MALVIWLLPDAFNSFLRASEGNKFTIPILREVLSRVTFFKIKFKKRGGSSFDLWMSGSWEGNNASNDCDWWNGEEENLIIGHAGKCMKWKMLDQSLELSAGLRKGIPSSIPSSGPWWQHNLLIITPSAWPERSSITQPFVLLWMLSKHSWNSHFLLDLHGNSHKTILEMSGETASNGAALAKENILQFWSIPTKTLKS